jgi:hypothetical protein
VKNFSQATDAKGVRGFLGLASYSPHEEQPRRSRTVPDLGLSAIRMFAYR